MILHICTADKKFIPSFIDLVNKEFFSQQHYFLVYGNAKANFFCGDHSNVEFWPCLFSICRNYLLGYRSLKRFLSLANRSDKIILHGLWDGSLVKLLVFYPRLLKKCYWVIWGGDLYYFKFRKKNLISNIHEFFRRIFIKRLGYLVTGTKGDFGLVKSIYSSQGGWIKSFVYTSNVFDYSCLPVTQNKNANLKILIGNSADPSNNQDEILDKLIPFKNQSFDLFCPLNYGNVEHAKKITQLGLGYFGSRFNPLLTFMPLDEYLNFLTTMDIAIFAHKRQQAFGNILMLLGLGKKVFIRKESTLWNLLPEYGLVVFDYDNLELTPLDEKTKNANIEAIKKYFSRDALIDSLKSWLS